MGNRKHLCAECQRPVYNKGTCYLCNLRIRTQKIADWPKEKVQAKIQEISEKMKKSKNFDDFYEVLHDLIALHDISTKELAQVAYEKRQFYPAVIYKDSSDELRDKLIDELLDPTCPIPGELLSALAYIGDDKVFETFLKLEREPLPWAQNLCVPPRYFASFGDWSFKIDGPHANKRIDTIYPICYTLEDKRFAEVQGNEVAAVFQEGEGTCGACKCRYVDFIDLNGTSESLKFLGLDGYLKLTGCPNCITCVGEPVVFRYELDGSSEMIDAEEGMDDNYVRDEDYQLSVNNQFGLSSYPKPRYASYVESTNVVGGSAYWIQDPEVTDCPDCNKTMKFLAYLDWYQFLPGAEGGLYIQICTDCKIATIIHQQT